MARKTAKSFHCPRCGATPGKPCISERIPSANTLGGGWGGYPPTQRPHQERYQVYRTWKAAQEVLAKADQELQNHKATQASYLAKRALHAKLELNKDTLTEVKPCISKLELNKDTLTEVKPCISKRIRVSTMGERLAETAEQIGRSNAAMCMDQKAPVDSYLDNTIDTANEYSVNVNDAVQAFFKFLADNYYNVRNRG